MTRKLVDKQVRINLYPFQNSVFMLEAFQVAAREQGWEESEIRLVSNQTNDLSLSDQYEVLMRYCETQARELSITQDDIIFMCSHLNDPVPYLVQKPISEWDTYDWEHYNSLKRRATKRIRRVFAHFAETVDESDKYDTEMVSDKHFDTFDEALEAVPVGQELLTNIYPLWIEE